MHTNRQGRRKSWEKKRILLSWAFSVIQIEDNLKLDWTKAGQKLRCNWELMNWFVVFILSAAFVAEDDDTSSTFAQLRLGGVSTLAPRKYRGSRPIWEVTALCTLAALACFIGLILVANSQNLCLEHKRRASGRKPHEPTCQSGVPATACRD